MDNPKVSVYITCYNLEQFIARSIESVLNQTLNIYEIIIIDDASTDNSRKVINFFCEKHPGLIVPVYNDTNLGISKNRNLAIQYCTGDYLAGIDGDDIWFPKKLQTEYEALKKFNADFAFSKHLRFSDNFQVEDHACGIISYIDLSISELHEKTLLRQFGASLYRSELVKIECVKLLGGYDAAINLYEDYDFKIRLTSKFKGIGVDVVTEGYRINPTGLSQANSFRHFQSLQYIYQKYERNYVGDIPTQYIQFFSAQLNSQLFNAFKKSEISFFKLLKYFKKRHINQKDSVFKFGSIMKQFNLK